MYLRRVSKSARTIPPIPLSLIHIFLKEGETSSEEEIKEFVLSHMAKHKVPRYVGFVKEFPMNAAGKILKYKMREEAVELLKLQKANSIETA